MSQQARMLPLLSAVAALMAQAPAQEVGGAAREIPPLPAPVAQRAAALSARLQASVRLWVEDQARRQRSLPSPDLESIRSAARVRFALPPGPGIAPVAPPPLRPTPGKTPGATHPNAFAPQASAPPPGPADIESLAFLVMMQCTRDAEADLRTTMAEMKQHQDQKARLRTLLEEVQRAKPGSHPATAPCAEPVCGTAAERIRELAPRLPAKARLVPRPLATYGDLSRLQSELKDSLDSMGEMSEMDSLRLQMAMDRRAKLVAALSNLLKKMNDTSGSILGNLK